MINKNFTISSTSINSGVVIEVDTQLNITTNKTPLGNQETIKYFPKSIQFRNITGATLGINILSSDDEYKAYQADPTNYDLFSLSNNQLMMFNAVNLLPPAYKILVKSLGGTASASFIIECIGYQPRR